MDREALIRRRRTNRRLLVFLGGPVGLALLWLGVFTSLHGITALGALFALLAVGGWFMKPEVLPAGTSPSREPARTDRP